MTEWIQWRGGKNPAPGKRVNVKFRTDKKNLNEHLSESWDWTHNDSLTNIVAYQVVEEPKTEPTQKIKSDGGATSYYDFPEGCKTLNDLIEYKNMSFARGNIFKAAYRLGEKDGAETVYDLKKIIYFAERMLKIEEGKT